jgi:hypothetical protein
MKKDTEIDAGDDMRSEYDFSGAERGSAYRPLLKMGYTIREERADGTVTVTEVPPSEDVVVLEPDVRAYFPDSESVNHALRTIITLFPKSRKTAHATSPTGPDGQRRAAKPRRRSA